MVWSQSEETPTLIQIGEKSKSFKDEGFLFMEEYKTDYLRNLALVSHGGAGKTMLTEACLHFVGTTTRLGRIEDGSTISDFEDEEIRRGLSLSTSVIPIEYMEHKINLLDTPGYTDFIGEVISAMSVADGAAILVDAVSGAEVGTEVALSFVEKFHLPGLIVINKLDRDNADYQKAFQSIQELTDTRLIPIQLPWGEREEFQGVIDILSMKAYQGNNSESVEIPDTLKDAAETARMELIEAAAEGDDSLLEKYLESGELSQSEIVKGLKNVLTNRTFMLVLVSSATNEIGILPFLETVIKLFPSPKDKLPVKAEGKSGEEDLIASDANPLAVYVWKTTADPFVGRISYMRVFSGSLHSDSRVWNLTRDKEERFGTIYVIRGKENHPVKVIHSGDIVTVTKLSETHTGDTLCDKGHPLKIPMPDFPNALYNVAVTPETQADAGKLSPTLTRLCDEDMTLSWYQEISTNQTILQGMGDQHVDIAIRKAASKFQVNLMIDEPRVPYQETITKNGYAQYRHKKQSGGAGQFGEVHLRVEPLQDQDFEFVNEVFGGAISSGYMPAIEKGIRSVMKQGVLAGYPLVRVKVAITDGKEHPVDSKAIAFEIAAREGFKTAVSEAGVVLLEPIMNVIVTVPEANMGDVLGDLNSRRARVQGMDALRGRSIVTAQIPLAEIQRYTTDLRSITGGRGIFSMEFSHYEHVPTHLTEEISRAAKERASKED